MLAIIAGDLNHQDQMHDHAVHDLQFLAISAGSPHVQIGSNVLSHQSHCKDSTVPKESAMSSPLLRSFRFSSDNLRASKVVKITAISFSCVHHEGVTDGRLKRIRKTPLALSKNTILVATQKLLKPCVMNHETSSFHQEQLDAQRNLW